MIGFVFSKVIGFNNPYVHIEFHIDISSRFEDSNNFRFSRNYCCRGVKRKFKFTLICSATSPPPQPKALITANHFSPLEAIFVTESIAGYSRVLNHGLLIYVRQVLLKMSGHCRLLSSPNPLQISSR